MQSQRFAVAKCAVRCDRKRLCGREPEEEVEVSVAPMSAEAFLQQNHALGGQLQLRWGGPQSLGTFLIAITLGCGVCPVMSRLWLSRLVDMRSFPCTCKCCEL